MPAAAPSRIALLALAVLIAVRWQPETQAREPARDSAVSAQDRAEKIATQPLRDLNMMPRELPQKLLSVQQSPYDTHQLETCAAMAQEVRTLDVLLPADVDAVTYGYAPRNVGEVILDTGGAMIVGMMPFRGIVRAVSGAEAAEARRRFAINAGEARRSFIKGLGLARGCAPPAAPGPPQLAYDMGL